MAPKITNTSPENGPKSEAWGWGGGVIPLAAFHPEVSKPPPHFSSQVLARSSHPLVRQYSSFTDEEAEAQRG